MLPHHTACDILSSSGDVSRRRFLELAAFTAAATLGGRSALANEAGAPATEALFRIGGELPVSRLALGGMRLAANGVIGPARDPKAGQAVLRRAVELGVNLIDTADFYRSSDDSVRANVIIREALHPYPSNLVIATKIGPVFLREGGLPIFPREGGYRQATASEFRQLVEDNLRALDLPRLDLVYLRVGEPQRTTRESVAERFEVLAKLRQEGVIRHLGLSNVTRDQIIEARRIAPVAAVQNYLNIINREQMDSLDYCTSNGIAFFPFGPLGMNGRDNLSTQSVLKVAARHDATVYQIAIAWLLARSPAVLPIPGTGQLVHLEENMAARKITLTEQDLAELA
jgi:pyridoxine 4-dehydrogenase